MTGVPYFEFYLFAICQLDHFPHGHPIQQRIKQNKEEFIPGYILPSKMELIMPYGTGTKRVEKFEILVSDHQNHLKWVKHVGLNTPIRPVTGGCDAGFYEPYYIGKSQILTENPVKKAIFNSRW